MEFKCLKLKSILIMLYRAVVIYKEGHPFQIRESLLDGISGNLLQGEKENLPGFFFLFFVLKRNLFACGSYAFGP